MRACNYQIFNFYRPPPLRRAVQEGLAGPPTLGGGGRPPTHHSTGHPSNENSFSAPFLLEKNCAKHRNFSRGLQKRPKIAFSCFPPNESTKEHEGTKYFFGAKAPERSHESLDRSSWSHPLAKKNQQPASGIWERGATSKSPHKNEKKDQDAGGHISKHQPE